MALGIDAAKAAENVTALDSEIGMLEIRGDKCHRRSIERLAQQR